MRSVSICPPRPRQQSTNKILDLAAWKRHEDTYPGVGDVLVSKAMRNSECSWHAAQAHCCRAEQCVLLRASSLIRGR
eukprot:4623910-Alexandrium_andersonii.AAC.1